MVVVVVYVMSVAVQSGQKQGQAANIFPVVKNVIYCGNERFKHLCNI